MMYENSNIKLYNGIQQSYDEILRFGTLFAQSSGLRNKFYQNKNCFNRQLKIFKNDFIIRNGNLVVLSNTG